MKLPFIAIAGVFLFSIPSCGPQSEKQTQEAEVEQDAAPKIELIENDKENRVDVNIDGQLFTSYSWPDNVYKPILYPLTTSKGTEVTRGYPLQPREGERSDHMHQVGMWLNYGDVNGYDFWGNGSTGERNKDGGQIKHLSIGNLTDGTGEGSMVTTASWVDPAGKELLAEKTEFHFIADGSTRMIDRITTLTATGEKVEMNDTKEGMFGIRVARQLELPSKGEVTLTDGQGNPTTVKQMSNEGVSGNYRSSEGTEGDGVWGTRAAWMDLYGTIGGEEISLVICDHPDNISYPTYWHARGYGLFSANPFGVKDFTDGKEELNYVINPGDSITFKYRVIISSGNHLTDSEIDAYADEFAAKY